MTESWMLINRSAIQSNNNNNGTIQVSSTAAVEPGRRIFNADNPPLANGYLSNFAIQLNQANIVPPLETEEQTMVPFGGNPLNIGNHISNQYQVEPRRQREDEEKEKNGCKCKKTECTRGYCKCFKNGLYCSDSCECEGCFNRLQHEERVSKARTVINLRVHKPPRDIGMRHRKPCKCRKSKCMKEYCECFKTGFGCGDGCQCNNCENPFGTKTGYEQNLNEALEMPSNNSNTVLPVNPSVNAYQYSQPLTGQNYSPASSLHKPISRHVSQMIQAEPLQRLPMPYVNQTHALETLGDNHVDNTLHQTVQRGHYQRPLQRTHVQTGHIEHPVNNTPIENTHQTVQREHYQQPLQTTHSSERSIDCLVNDKTFDIIRQDVQTGFHHTHTAERSINYPVNQEPPFQSFMLGDAADDFNFDDMDFNLEDIITF